MNDLLDFIKNPRDREDFFIALIVILLFGAAITYTIFPKAQSSLSEQELVEELSAALTEGDLNTKIFTDIEDAEEFASLHEEEDAAVISHTNMVVIPNQTKNANTSTPITTENSEELTEAELYEENTTNMATETPPINVSPTEKETEEQVDSAEREANEEDIKDKLEELEAEELKDVKEDLAQLNTAKEKETATTGTPKNADMAANTKSKEELEEQQKKTNITKNDKVESEIAASQKNEETATDSENTPEVDARPAQEPETATPTPYEEATPTTPKAQQKSTKPNPSRTQKSSCVIVVGAFKMAEGVTETVERLKAAKYKTTTGYVRGLRYVGVPVDCNNHQKLMNEINEKFDKEAWLLKR